MAGNEFDIKFGYNKRSAATQNLQIILLDVQGGRLVDGSNAPLIAEIEGFVSSELTSDKAVSIILPTVPEQTSKFFSFIFAEEFEIQKKVGTTQSAFIRLINPEKTWQFLVVGFIIDAPTGNEILDENGVRSGYNFENFKIIQIIQEPTQSDGKLRVRLDLEQDPTNLNTINYIRRVITKRRTGTLKIEEQFAATSEVSTSLLGIDRAETQLSLFSNVSTYGFDSDSFVFYPDNPPNGPIEWTRRQTESGIAHYPAKVEEVKNEGALRLCAYPVPYNYPYPPLTQNFVNGIDVNGFYNEDGWKKWQNFLKLGKSLYEYFKNLRDSEVSSPSNFAKYNNFLDRFIPAINLWDDDTYYFGANYGSNLENYYRKISIWTDTFNKIFDGKLKNPVTFADINFTFLAQISIVLRGTGTDTVIGSGSVSVIGEVKSNPGGINTDLNPFLEEWINVTWNDSSTSNSPTGSDDFLPGYSPTGNHYVLLQSRQAFRYQPGRISGYTYGTRATLEQNEGDNTAEWGIFNDFDEYVFRREGANFYIVRRSVVQYEIPLLQELGLADADGNIFNEFVKTYTKTIAGNNYIIQEIKISKEKFNGDSLNGNGPSGYLLTTDEITMYKIEFGWYGAIGLRLYAYIPIENGEARWVVVHTFVIENKLKEPSMGDPFFKFKYELRIGSGQGPGLTQPQYLYKYGTSMYIDGGDEGTVSVYSETSDVKSLPNTGEFVSVLGIYPKKNIISGGKTSSGNSVSIPNKKIVTPKQISVTCDGFAELTLVTCKACIESSFLYLPKIISKINGDIRKIKKLPLNQTSNSLTLAEIVITPSNSTVGSASNTIETTDSDIQYLRPGDYLKEDTNAPNVIEQSRIASITENSGTYTISFVDENFANPSLEIGSDITFQPTFIISDNDRKIFGFDYTDFESKVIYEGGNVKIYNTYLGNNITGSFNETVGLLQRIPSNRFGIETERILDPRRIISDVSTTPFTPGDIFSNNNTETFDVRLSQLKAVAASNLPIAGPISRINWLNPTGRRDYNSVAEYEIGFTPFEPIISGDQLTGWKDYDKNTLTEFRNGNLVNRIVLNRSEYISVSWNHYAINYNTRYGIETGESWVNRILPLTQDFRVSNPVGTDSGECSEATIEKQPTTRVPVTQVNVSDNVIPSDDPSVWNEFTDQESLSAYLSISDHFLTSSTSNINTSSTPEGGQVAVFKNNVPIVNFYNNSGQLQTCRFIGPERTYESSVTAGGVTTEITVRIIPISISIQNSFEDQNQNTPIIVNPGDSFDIGYTSIVIKGWYSEGDRYDRPNSYSPTNNGTGVFNFNAYPLYPIAFMRDNSELRSVEISDTNFVGDITSYNPQWKVNYDSNNNPIIDYTINTNLATGQINVNGVGSLTASPSSINSLEPSAFRQVDRLSSAKIDKDGDSIVRPGSNLTTLYINNETKTFDLTDVFGSDRKVITPDVTNTEATYVVARSLGESTSIDIQVNITYSEQL